MKIFAFLSLFILGGCILNAGCVSQPNSGTEKCICPACPTGVNTTSPEINVTVNETIAKLKGPLRVSIGGWGADLPVSIDNVSVGVVTKSKPLDLMLDEGNHTVKVCSGMICEEEVVEIRFARQRLVDFEERLIKDAEFAMPTARIVSYYPSGDAMTVAVEFINPSQKDVTISGEIKFSYTYIEARSNSRVGGVAQSLATANVKAGSRVTQTLNLNLASGYSYSYSIPVISDIKTR